MGRRGAILFCLVFSGLSALVYQIIWTRLLGFAFGTTTEAISTVLAVFFGGLALGNFAAARLQARVERPLRLYAVLELGIGAYALLSLPLLRGLDHVARMPHGRDQHFGIEVWIFPINLDDVRDEFHPVLTDIVEPAHERRNKCRPGFCCQQRLRRRKT